MKIVRNAGTDRVVDLVRPWLADGVALDLVTSGLSLFAFGDLSRELAPIPGRLWISGFDAAMATWVSHPEHSHADRRRHSHFLTR